MGMSGYQAWLEAPYQAREREAAAHEEYCERFDLDPDEVDQDEVRDYYEGLAEDAAEARAEARAERDADFWD